jgi:hypothetical protein
MKHAIINVLLIIAAYVLYSAFDMVVRCAPSSALLRMKGA